MNAVLLQFIRRLSAADGSPDAELLRRFARDHDEAAFASLLQRHGPMVFGVCRRLLPQAEDAEDAFQTTFLVLARKAGSIANPAQLANGSGSQRWQGCFLGSVVSWSVFQFRFRDWVGTC